MNARTNALVILMVTIAIFNTKITVPVTPFLVILIQTHFTKVE